MRIALLQINPTAGDIAGNSALIVEGVTRSKETGAELVVTPELALMGYLPRDLLMSRGFVTKSCEELTRIAGTLADAPPALIGLATRQRETWVAPSIVLCAAKFWSVVS